MIEIGPGSSRGTEGSQGPWWSRPVWRRAAAMLVRPSRPKTLMARFHRKAMAPVRILEASSRNARPRTWCRRFSMPQWPLVHVAISVQVGTLDGQLPGAQVAPPPHDLDGLTGAGVVEVAELGDFDPADLVAVVGVVAGTVPERNVPPGQLPDLGAQAGRIRLHDGHVVSAAADRTAAVSVQGVGGDRGVLRIQAVQPRREGGNLVALAGDLPLGQDHDVAVLAHNPCTTFPSTATTRHADDFPSGNGRDAAPAWAGMPMTARSQGRAVPVAGHLRLLRTTPGIGPPASVGKPPRGPTGQRRKHSRKSLSTARSMPSISCSSGSRRGGAISHNSLPRRQAPSLIPQASRQNGELAW